MKMTLFERILLTLYTLAILLFSLFILVTAIGVISWDNLMYSLNLITYDWKLVVTLIVMGLFFLLTSIKFLFSGMMSKKNNSSILKNTELGVIRVSQITLDTLAQKAVKEFNEVKDVKSSIIIENDGIIVQLKIMVMPEVNIPQLTQKVQGRIKEYIESLAGIVVKAVPIYVDNITASNHPRAE